MHSTLDLLAMERCINIIDDVLHYITVQCGFTLEANVKVMVKVKVLVLVTNGDNTVYTNCYLASCSSVGSVLGVGVI